jgi:hypothetical protein
LAVFRLLVILAALGVAGLVLAWLLTSHRRLLDWAFILLKITLGTALLFFAVLIVERLV